MTFEELQKFIDIEDERLSACYDYSDKEKKILANTVKLTEEIGELSDEVLSSMSFQRKVKVDNRSSEHLAEEFADVIIVAFLLAKTMNINVTEALKKKIEKIEERHRGNNFCK